MQMDSGLDTGDILAQEEIQIGDLNSQQLHDRLASIGGSLLLKTLDMMEKEILRHCLRIKMKLLMPA